MAGLLVTVGVNDPSATYNTANFTSDEKAIQAAIDHVAANGGGTVKLGVGTFQDFQDSIILKSHVDLVGSGEGQTVLQAGLAFGDAILTDHTSRTMSASMSDFTIDVEFVQRSSGFKVMNFEDFALSNVTIEHIGWGGWGAFFGVNDAINDDSRNEGLTIAGLTVDDHRDSTLESVLIFNTNNASGDMAVTNRTSGPGVGLWQKVDGANLQVTGENVTGNGSTLFYYSYSTDNLDISVTGENIRSLVTGGNESDHGLFGYDRIQNVNLHVSGSGTGQPGAGVQLGGIDGGHITIGTLTNFEVPILINGGNATAGYTFMSRNFVIEGGEIYGNNPGDDFHALHPGILIQGDGVLNGVIQDVKIYDTTGTQRYPIAVEASSIDNLVVLGGRLVPGPAGQSVQVNVGSILGDKVVFINTPDPVVLDNALAAHFKTAPGLLRVTSSSDLDVLFEQDIDADGTGAVIQTDIFDIDAVANVALTNAKLITATDTGIVVLAEGGTVTLTNSGTIQASSAGVHVTASQAKIVNSGVIRGDNVALRLTEGDDQVTSTGTIIGHTLLMGGNDSFAGGASIDHVDGGSGNDTVFGGAGADTIQGGDGDDLLGSGMQGSDFDGGVDVLLGGAGNDVAYLTNRDSATNQEKFAGHFDGGSGVDDVYLNGSVSDYTIVLRDGIYHFHHKSHPGEDYAGRLIATAKDIERFEGVDLASLTVETPWSVRPKTAAGTAPTDMSQIRDYDGNDLGALEAWKLIGQVDVQFDGDAEFIFVNPENGRWATVGPDRSGNIDFADFGKGGETRVVGIYIDPLVDSGEVVRGSDFDSQQRFQNDLRIDNLTVIDAFDFDKDGFQEIYFKVNDGTAYLRALMHADGNIQYANYQNAQQVSAYLMGLGYGQDVVDTILI